MPARAAVALMAVAVMLVLIGCDSGQDPEPAQEAQGPVRDEPAASPEGGSDQAADEPAEDAAPDDPPSDAEAHDEGQYAVSAGHPDAVDAGIAILEEGGNAVDAAVAAAFAVAVVEPFASGIGGGGHALVAAPDADPLAYDYREVVAADGRVPGHGTGVPGFVAGMQRLHDEHGDLAWDALLVPAVELAEETTASGLLVERLQAAARRLPASQMPHFFPGGHPLAEGAELRQDELADTLARLASDGAATFYEGAMADEVAAAVDGVDAASLAGYEVQSTTPPAGQFGAYEIVGAAPPLPGSTLVQQLQIAEAAGAGDEAPGSAGAVHATAMAWRVGLAHIETDLGDPDFVDVPVEVHTDVSRNREIAGAIPEDGLLAADSAQLLQDVAPNTTHVTTVDAEGRIVSMTNTLTNFWGSGQYALGFFLNDQLNRFSIGRSGANEPEPGRRSVSWSLPVVVLDGQGRPVLGIGTPGGQRIPNVLTQVLTDWALRDASLDDAVTAPRYHLEGDRLQVEEPFAEDTAADLLTRGYTGFDPQPALYFGSVQALELDPETGEVNGAVDPRRDADWRSGAP